MSNRCIIWMLFVLLWHCCNANAQNNCIDLRDLNAPFVHCTYGSFGNPYMNHGVAPGRHTVITQQSYDENTCIYSQGSLKPQLCMIPPGETYSIKLGNSHGGEQAESIALDINIDTNHFDLLILKYAAVLQNPDHAPSEQPRFKFEIMDTLNNLIDTLCLSSDFVADTTLGWNVASRPRINLWKDWTNVGFDVSPFQNQTIRIRLTTFDCCIQGLGHHFGYAYFLLTCAKKRIDVDVCGDVDQYTYSAPIGFNYDWFWRDDPSHSISHDQTVQVPTGSNRELGCHVSFTENPSCGFDLYTTTEYHFPLSGCSVLETDCPNEYQFINESLISNDGVHPDGTGNQCDDVFWDFGDGQSSLDFNPTHAYSTPGDHTVKMVAGLNGFQCTDTSFLEVHVPENTFIDTVTCEPFLWESDVYTVSGEYHKKYTTASGCDSLVFLKLDANYQPSFHINGNHWPIGGTELAWTEYTYQLALDNPLCSVDSIHWSVDCPMMALLPEEDGMSCKLRIFSCLPSNDSVPLRAVAYNRCGTEERTLWIHTSFYGIDEHEADFSVFPNPNSGRLTIKTKGMVGDIRLELYDRLGTIVDRWTQYTESDGETFVYDTSRLGEGLYTLRIIHHDQSFTKKVVIKK